MGRILSQKNGPKDLIIETFETYVDILLADEGRSFNHVASEVLPAGHWSWLASRCRCPWAWIKTKMISLWALAAKTQLVAPCL